LQLEIIWALTPFFWIVFGRFLSWNDQFEVSLMLFATPVNLMLGTGFLLWSGVRRSAA